MFFTHSFPGHHYGAPPPPPPYGHDYYGDSRGADPYSGYGGYGGGYGGGYSAPPPAAAPGSPTYCLFVYNLPATADDGYLYRLFGPYGAILNVKIVRDLATQLCKVSYPQSKWIRDVPRVTISHQGYGFVHYSRMEDAQQAIMALNGYQIAPNKALQVSFKTPGRSSNPPAVPAPGATTGAHYAAGPPPPAY